MILLESPIVNDPRFHQYTRLYKRFIDDLFLIWTSPSAVLCDFRCALATADEAISLDWSGYGSQKDAVDRLHPAHFEIYLISPKKGSKFVVECCSHIFEFGPVMSNLTHFKFIANFATISFVLAVNRLSFP